MLIYNRALSAAEILTLTNQTAGPAAPVAAAGADQTVTDTDGTGFEEVVLDGSGSSDSDGTIVSYAWREGGTPLANGVNPTVSLAVGTHTIELEVTDNDSQTAVDTVVVTVDPQPVNVALASRSSPGQT